MSDDKYTTLFKPNEKNSWVKLLSSVHDNFESYGILSENFL